MAARNRARTPVRIRCIKKTTPPETSCGTPEEAYKVPPSLTVAIRDQQLRLVPSRRPRPEQHSPRIPLVPRALLRALETELLDQRAPFHVLGRDVAAHLLDRRRVVRDEADGRERRSPPSSSANPDSWSCQASSTRQTDAIKKVEPSVCKGNRMFSQHDYKWHQGNDFIPRSV